MSYCKVEATIRGGDSFLLCCEQPVGRVVVGTIVAPRTDRLVTAKSKANTIGRPVLAAVCIYAN